MTGSLPKMTGSLPKMTGSLPNMSYKVKKTLSTAAEDGWTNSTNQPIWVAP